MGITNTTNLNLEQPDGNEFKLREFHNDNMDILDGYAGTKFVKKLYNSTDQSISNASSTVLNFDRNINTSTGAVETITSTTKITVDSDGWYDAYTSVRFAANTVGTRQVNIQVNGSGIPVSLTTQNATTTSVAVLESQVKLYLSSGDYLEVRVVQSSGGALDVEYADFYSPIFAVNKIYF